MAGVGIAFETGLLKPTIMKKINVLAMMIIAASSFQSCGNGDMEKKDGVDVAKDINDKNSKQVSDKTSDFMVKSASGGMMEVELGKIAQEKAVDARVKAFGAMMVADHTTANNEMKIIADGKSVTLPPALSDEHQKYVDKLKQKSGAEFDQAYISMMVDDHKDDISEFEDASKMDDADIKGFAGKTLPVLKKHLDSAQAINSALKK